MLNYVYARAAREQETKSGQAEAVLISIDTGDVATRVCPLYLLIYLFICISATVKICRTRARAPPAPPFENKAVKKVYNSRAVSQQWATGDH